ncbi:hypothetical protein NBO_58gi002 [Nosema bombycis CQ1]|uniref:Uncharacterized protein n=1 Tax=Nosema bombycis (strain CQ1 / CVCC 102059) TaxID=578461 RepID=R0MLU0_NOSB1|nr:hypothetical protein NBO_58gi002 [Nosema bombycis CQ1]|eukprot:EOB13803.1 hypothetical protein NBO_58gi002 [Nosema bombycis CQ1]
MLECALYSYVSSLEEIKRFRKMFKEDVYEYNELVYSKNDTLIIIRTNEKITKIIKKKQVDKNKNRKYVIHVVEMSEADSFENLIQFLDLFNYKFINKTEVKEHLFTSENFYVSVSKEINDQHLKTNNIDKYWLVKAFSLSDNLQTAEQVFNSKISNLEGFLEFKKVEVKCFDD